MESPNNSSVSSVYTDTTLHDQSNCRSIVLCIFGEPCSPRRCMCYVYAFLFTCVIFAGIIMLCIGPQPQT